jgi:hypothetical protein
VCETEPPSRYVRALPGPPALRARRRTQIGHGNPVSMGMGRSLMGPYRAPHSDPWMHGLGDGTRTRDLRRDRPARRNRLHNRLQPGITGYSRHLIAERTATPDFRRLHPAGPV